MAFLNADWADLADFYGFLRPNLLNPPKSAFNIPSSQIHLISDSI